MSDLIFHPAFRGQAARVTGLLAGVAVAWFAVAAVLKATNDPALSNKWVFYSRQEAASLSWTDQHLQQAVVWTSFDERLSIAFEYDQPQGSRVGNSFAGFALRPGERDVIFSAIERLRGFRLGEAMPIIADWQQTYDNGQVQLYHKRPITPFQQ